LGFLCVFPIGRSPNAWIAKLAQEESTYKLEEDDSENGAPQTNDAEDSNDKSEEDKQQQQRNPLRRLSNTVTIRRACRKAIAGNYSRGSILL
jgi:hypothetical protein